MASFFTLEFGLPVAFISWSEALLILIAVLFFGLPVLLRVRRALRGDNGGYR